MIKARLILANRVIKRGGSRNDPKVVKEVKEVRSQHKHLEIRSPDDRIAAAKFLIATAIIKQFGDVSILFRIGDTYFEHRLIVCPGKKN